MIKKNLLGNLIVGLVTLVILFGLGEILARVYLSKTDDTTKELTIYQSSETLGWEHVPNSQAKQKWGGKNITYTINSQGLRGDEVPIQKTEGKKRIAILGDSFTFGMLMNDDETYPAKLQKLFGENAEVLNFGVIGYATDQYYLTLTNKVLRYNPDSIIVAYFVGNDATELRAHEWETYFGNELPRAGAVPKKIRDKWHVISEDHQLRRRKTSLLPRSYLIGFFRERGRILLSKFGLPVRWPNLFFSNFLPKDHPQGDRHINEYYQVVQHLFSVMAKNASGIGAKLLVLLIPADIQVDLKYLEKYPRAPFGEKEFMEALPQKRVTGYLEELNIPFLDLLPLFREISKKENQNLYFEKKDPHFDAFGHEKTAELLFERLKSL